MSSEEKTAFRAELREAEVRYVDQPHRLDPDFEQAVETYVANYVQQ